MNNKLKNLQSLTELIKYALVGASNIAIDIIILNILSYSTGITSGKMLFVFNTISFFVYSFCGYHLNNKFTFRKITSENAYFQYASVLFFSMILNSAMLVILTSKNPLLTFMQSQADIASLNHLWMNISIVFDSIVIGFLGFLINKFFVFNKNKAC
jgi:putative flippase GtrA